MNQSIAAKIQQPPPASASAIRTPRDPNTLSNYHNYITEHTTVNFELDFEKKRIFGNVVLRLKSLIEAKEGEPGHMEKVVLDTSFLDIKTVKVNGKDAKWGLGSRFEPYGNPLSIDLGRSLPKDETVELDAIHARSLFPCQDTPDVKSTFDFNVRSPLPVLASGLPTGSKDYQPGKDGGSGTLLYTFKQEVPIPSYLFALAAGDLACASIGPRSTVWTGPEELQAAKWEFDDDMEKFMEAIEKLVYPYAWTTYNVLVLPPSFPYGGMENPVFTFATPTIISGDKENIDVIAHELSHSWSGNLVSNASWEHFWLNEGWTTYLERRIQGAIHGEPHRHFSAIIGWKALQDSVERFGEDNEFTKLIVDLKGKDPDDAFSSVPYEKGFVFLFHLENLIGKDKWDKFIPHYFTTWKNKSLDSYDFKATLLDFFSTDSEASKKLNDLDWDTWFYKPGYPPKPNFDTSMVDVCYKLADQWVDLAKGKNVGNFRPQSSDISGWSANQSVVFLEKLQTQKEPLPAPLVEQMGHYYGYAQSQNAELVARYLQIGLDSRVKSLYQPAADFLGKVGRMKFVRPTYKRLNEADRKLAVETFEKNKDFYHPICRMTVEKDLFGEKKE